jgi:hypothetical protein
VSFSRPIQWYHSHSDPISLIFIPWARKRKEDHAALAVVLILILWFTPTLILATVSQIFGHHRNHSEIAGSYSLVSYSNKRHPLQTAFYSSFTVSALCLNWPSLFSRPLLKTLETDSQTVSCIFPMSFVQADFRSIDIQVYVHTSVPAVGGSYSRFICFPECHTA